MPSSILARATGSGRSMSASFAAALRKCGPRFCAGRTVNLHAKADTAGRRTSYLAVTAPWRVEFHQDQRILINETVKVVRGQHCHFAVCRLMSALDAGAAAVGSYGARQRQRQYGAPQGHLGLPLRADHAANTPQTRHPPLRRPPSSPSFVGALPCPSLRGSLCA